MYCAAHRNSFLNALRAWLLWAAPITYYGLRPLFVWAAPIRCFKHSRNNYKYRAACTNSLGRAAALVVYGLRPTNKNKYRAARVGQGRCTKHSLLLWAAPIEL